MLTSHKREIRSAHGIRIGRDLESRVLTEHVTQVVGHHILSEANEKLRLNPTMICTGRLTDDELPANKLRALAGDVDGLELLGGHDVRHHRSSGRAEYYHAAAARVNTSLLW